MNMQRIYECYDITALHDLRLIDLLHGEIDLDFLSSDDADEADDSVHFFD